MRSLIATVELMEITESMLNLKVVFLKGSLTSLCGLCPTQTDHIVITR